MKTFTVTYVVKYELSINPNYIWTSDNLCFNLKTGRRIKQVYKNGMIGYCVAGKFKSLKYIRPLLQKPIKTHCPF